MEIPAWEAIARLALAAALGAAIGIEREHHGRSAGFRTQLLVGLGAAMVMLVSLYLGQAVREQAGLPGGLRADVAGAIGGIMGGIGFLGAGAILRSGLSVTGLTTAASLWCTAAVGMATGFGMYVIAIVATLIALFALSVLAMLDDYIPTTRSKTLTVIMPFSSENVPAVRKAVAGRGAKITGADYHRDYQSDVERIVLYVSLSSRTRIDRLLDIKNDLPNIRQFVIADTPADGARLV